MPSFVIGTNVIAMISFRRYLKRKAQLNAHTNNPNREEMTEQEKQKTKEAENLNKTLLFMTLYLSLFAGLIHLLQTSTAFVTFIFVLDTSLSAFLLFITVFSIGLKNLMKIFFYSCFSRKFRHELFKCYRVD